MTVFLVLWLVLLTLAMIVGGLMVVGKFVRVDRAQAKFAEGVFDELDMMGNSVELMMKDFKKLAASFENLPKPPENFDVVSEQVSQLLSQVANLAEIQENFQNLREELIVDVKALLRADKEHPVLAPATPNKGGRPKREGN